MRTQVNAYANVRVYTHTSIEVRVRVPMCTDTHVSVSMSTCARVSIYRCIYVRRDTHRHTRTETHIRAYRRGKREHIAKGAFSVHNGSRRQTTQPPQGKQPPTSEVGRQGARADTFLPKKGRTGRHPEAQGRKPIRGRAGLGWGCWGWGRAHGSTPGRLSGQRVLRTGRGKAQELESESRGQVRHIRRRGLLIDRTRLCCR